MCKLIGLPSGKLFDLDRFIALLPDRKNEQYELFLEGYSLPINLEKKDVLALKECFNQNEKLSENIENWDTKEQIRKNKPLMNLAKKWLEQKNEKFYTEEDVQEYKEIQLVLS